MTHRRFPLLKLSVREIERLMQNAFPRTRLCNSEQMTEGGTNTNFRVYLKGHKGSYLLRIFRRDPSACAKESSLLTLLKGQLPVARVIYAETEPVNFSSPFLIASWLDGASLQRVLRTCGKSEHEQLGESVGSMLFEIGQITFPRWGMLNGDLTVGRWVSCESFTQRCVCRNAGRHLGARLSEQLLNLMYKESPRLAPSGQARLVHSDFNPSNIILNRHPTGWQISGILDWEWAHSGHPLFDVGTLLRHDVLFSSSFQRGFIHGFKRAGGTLPRDWRRRILLLDLVNLIEMIDTPNSLNANQESFRKRIAATVEFLTRR